MTDTNYDYAIPPKTGEGDIIGKRSSFQRWRLLSFYQTSMKLMRKQAM